MTRPQKVTQDDLPTLTRLQFTVERAYYSAVVPVADNFAVEDLTAEGEDTGDSLLDFLLRELVFDISDTPDEALVEAAQYRIGIVRDQINAVHAALMALDTEEG